MSKYIKLEDAKGMFEFCTKDNLGGWIAAMLDSLPAIEIVECKDCVHCADDWNGNQPQFTCELGLCTESIYPNDFCSVGERRDND